MTAAAAADQDDLVRLLRAGTGDNVSTLHTLNVLGESGCHSVEHLINYIVDTIDQFFHDYLHS